MLRGEGPEWAREHPLMQGGEMRAGGYATPWATVEDCLHAFPACREKLAKLEAAGGTFAKVVEKSPEALTAMEKSVVEGAEAVGCASTVGVGQHATVREVVDADGLHWAWKNWREGWDETDKQDRERTHFQFSEPFYYHWNL